MKMKFTTITLILFFSLGLCLVQAQQITPSKTENYIMQVDYLTEQGTSGDKSVSIQYFDGLGRPKQSVQVQATPTGKDLVTPIEYDGFGRQAKDHLPVPTSQTTGAYIQPNAINDNYYLNQYGENTWFSEKTFEDSSLNRVMAQAAPGDDWAKGSGHEIGFKYATNKTSEVKIYTVNGESISRNGFYLANSLYKTTTTDENGNKISEFKDKQGRVVLKRAYNPPIVDQNDQSTDGIGTPPALAIIMHDTYYIYDIYSNLVAVVPPLAAEKSNLTSDQVNALCYLYRYDARNRLIEKKLPGKEKEYMVYDKQDRLVATQDANLRNQGKWQFTKYDKFGRMAYTGIYSDPSDHQTIQELVNSFGKNNEERKSTVQFTLNFLPVFYTKTAFPTSKMEILSVNYYDSYDKLDFILPTTVMGETNLRKEKNELQGMSIASYLRIIGTQHWEKTFTVYNKKSRAVGTYKTNHLGGETKIESKLNFTGLPLITQTTHKRTANTIEVKIEEVFTYDSQLRLIKHTHAIGNATPQVIAINAYDELGQLVVKKVGGTQNGSDRWQQVDYQYNIRGWLTDINNIYASIVYKIPSTPGETHMTDDLFSFKINYNTIKTDLNANTEPLYNGNIAQTFWRAGSDNQIRGYNYHYDKVNRLLNAQFHAGGLNPFTGAYRENLTYDLNGNITQLTRTTGDANGNAISMDELTYAYKDGNNNSNLLLNVTDNSSTNSSDGFKDGNTNPALNDYEYDPNGNMIKDRNKGIESIAYNHLNLPTKITWANNKYISYQYNAAGQKVSKSVREHNDSIKVVDYLDSFQYAGNQLQFFPHAEGYVRVNTNKSTILGNKYNYVYNYTDHLGNVRVSYSKDPQTGELEILEESHYYPFGLKHNIYTAANLKDFRIDEMGTDAIPGGGMGEVALINVTKTDYNYKYNSKELQDELGLDWYDYGARNYDAALGRWMNVDSLAEQFPGWSPYNYTMNNPINLTDPTGMAPEDWVLGKNGSIYWDKNAVNQSTTKAGDTYLGKDLTFTFNSYIDKSFDGPQPPWEVTGDKLTSTITVNSTKNSDGSLKSVDVTSDYFVHETGGMSMFKGRDYFPGLGSDQNKEISLTGVRSFNATFEQHASVPGFEAAGLNLLGFDVVNVAQQMNMSLSGNQLSISAGTDVFPSATLDVNGNQLFQYNQPSFRATHGRDRSFSDNGRGGVDVITTPRRPAPSIYPRYKK